MKNNTKTWLFDILSAIDEIDQFFPIGQRKFEEYQKDIKTKRAVERNLEIIGEAMNRIVNSDDEIEIGHARKIIALRNRIIHGYDNVSDELIWGILINDLPVLKAEISSVI